MIAAHLADAVERLGLRGHSLLVAVSGGLDSMVLLHGLCDLAPRAGLRLTVGHIDHGLRGPESEDDGRFVQEQAADRGLRCLTEQIEPAQLRGEGPSRSRPTLQEAARTLRYASLGRMAAEARCSTTATAHHANDQAETVLLRLLRGSGPDGLAGMRERSADGRLVRPLLGVARSEIEAFAKKRGVEWREDSSNRSDSYARNRLRRRWFPGLAEEFNPQLLRTLTDLAETCRTDADWMAVLVAEETRTRVRASEEGLEIVRDGWSEMPDALKRRIAHHVLREMGIGREVNRTHIERVADFVGADSGAQCRKVLQLPLGVTLERRSRSCVLRRSPVSPGGAC